MALLPSWILHRTWSCPTSAPARGGGTECRQVPQLKEPWVLLEPGHADLHESLHSPMLRVFCNVETCYHKPAAVGLLGHAGSFAQLLSSSLVRAGWATHGGSNTEKLHTNHTFPVKRPCLPQCVTQLAQEHSRCFWQTWRLIARLQFKKDKTHLNKKI